MIFTIYMNFSGIYMNLFRFLKLFKTKKNAKMGAFIARAHVDATWHSGPRGSTTLTHASACVARM